MNDVLLGGIIASVPVSAAFSRYAFERRRYRDQQRPAGRGEGGEAAELKAAQPRWHASSAPVDGVSQGATPPEGLVA